MDDDLRRLKRARKPRNSGSTGADTFLGPLEAAVMDHLWKRHSATVRDVVDDIGRSRSLAYTTVMTIMTRLHVKGLLIRDRDGKTYVYRPAFTREEHRARLSRDIVRGLVDEFGDVALAHFTAELSGVDAAHRASLRRLADKEQR
ncbi:MAG TPA: BlaI/MecI/CopY family transcriptional regulator [Candidatus Saccharimonadales bacterium]|nr:BlaI/MecI/CopY family transcriptional regulator [Candidatus Saccharimonadales bacterium]